MELLTLTLSEDKGKGLPPLTLELPRITVVLGRNGAGKTTLLNRLSEACSHTKLKRRLVSGDVVPHVPGPGASGVGAWENVATMQKAEAAFENAKESSSETRIAAAIAVLFHREKHERLRYADAVEQFDKEDRSGEHPVKPDRPFRAMVNILRQFVPDIAIEATWEPPRFVCSRKGNRYSFDQLSSGERQLLFLAADLLSYKHENFLVLVDEPELHLNPGLACRAWSMVEEHLPHCRFVYATHSVDFANRPTVQRVLVVRDASSVAQHLPSLEDLEPEDRREFLGAIPGVLWSERIVAVEGVEGGLDSRLIEWMLHGQSVRVLPLRSRQAVLDASKGSKPWNCLLKAGKLVGVVDRDFNVPEGASTGGPSFVYSWPYHEIESLLCLPEVVSALAEKAGVSITEDDITRAIVSSARSLVTRTAACRVATSCDGGLRISARQFSEGLGIEEMERELLMAVGDARGRWEGRTENALVCKCYRAACAELDTAIGNMDVSTVLAYVEGKRIASRVLQSLGLGTSETAAATLVRDCSVAAFPTLHRLALEISERFTPEGY